MVNHFGFPHTQKGKAVLTLILISPKAHTANHGAILLEVLFAFKASVIQGILKMETKHALALSQVGGFLINIFLQTYIYQEKFTAEMLTQGVVDK